MDVFVVRFGLPEGPAPADKVAEISRAFQGLTGPRRPLRSLQLNGFSGLGGLYWREENPCPPNVPRPSPIILLA
jgi:hypothetical protein